jgi:CheY-like chemotaxis protein
LNHQKNYYIVDDDADDQQFLIEALTENDQSVQCIIATNGQAAIDHLKSGSSFLPDAIFLDQNMPGLSGRQCLVELKRTPSLKHIPVIVYSTSFDEREIHQIMQLGAFYFLVKGSSFDLLKKELKTISTALDNNQILPVTK